MKIINRRTNWSIKRKANNILYANALGYDSDKYDFTTSFTILKKDSEAVLNEFKLLGYIPKIESEDNDFIVYIMPYNKFII